MVAIVSSRIVPRTFRLRTGLTMMQRVRKES
jgi:hypothetical protein